MTITAPSITEDEHGNLSCSEHGDTLIPTTGKWTGRPMAECTVCGAYLVTGEAS